MRIQSLRLTGFRNYATLQLNTDAKAVLLTGTNGAGKTNLLEALSLLAPGRGLRRAPRDELGYRSQTSEHPASWAIFAELNGHEGPAVIGTGLADANEKGRSIRINHAPATQGDLLDCVSVSWLTPQMDGLFLASPSQRRPCCCTSGSESLTRTPTQSACRTTHRREALTLPPWPGREG